MLHKARELVLGHMMRIAKSKHLTLTHQLMIHRNLRDMKLTSRLLELLDYGWADLSLI